MGVWTTRERKEAVMNHTCKLFSAIAVIAFAFLPSEAAANPVPEAAMVPDVQMVPHTITDCHDIETTYLAEIFTPLTVAIDVYALDHYGQESPMYWARLGLQWPSEWQLVSWVPSENGSITDELTGPGDGTSLSWSPGKVFVDGVALIGTLTFVVPVSGMVDIVDHPSYGYAGYYTPDGGWMELHWAAGHAYVGEFCDLFPSHPCMFGYWCSAGSMTDSLSFVLAPGESDRDTFSVWFGSGPDPCEPDIYVDEDWLELEYISGDDTGGTYAVTCNSLSLPGGPHEGNIRIESGVTRKCIEVSLWVQDCTVANRINWGRLKALFRQ
jgi:hypothetical protein